jgi:acyl carrier protein
MTAQHQRESLLELVRTDVAAVLGYGPRDTIDSARPFADLGLDSLTALDLRDRLGAATGLPLSVALPFEYPTCAALASHLWEQIRKDVPRIHMDILSPELDPV